MSKAIAIVFASTLLIAVATIGPISVEAAGPAPKVTVCHYSTPEHNDAINGAVSDWVPFSKAAPLCIALGGNPIDVSPSACRNGHNAIELVFGVGPTCDEGDLQL